MAGLSIAAWLIAAGVAAVSLWAASTGRRGIGLGILFAAASFSGVTAPILESGVRLEQPAVLVLLGYVAARERDHVRSLLSQAWLPILLVAIYLAVNVVSAILQSPDVVQSLKLTAWLGLSIGAALVAAVLILGADPPGSDLDLPRWIVGAGCVSTAVAGLQVILEFMVQSDWGVLRWDTPIGKAEGLAWEPNLLSIQLGASLIFVLDPRSGERFSPRTRVTVTAILAGGMGLAVSRGGIVALAIGLCIVGLSLIGPWRRTRQTGGIASAIRLSVLAFVIAIAGYGALAWLGDMGVGVRPGDPAPVGDGNVGSNLIPVGPDAGIAPSPTPGGSVTAEPIPAPTIGTPLIGETIVLRLQNLETAVRDGMTSPLIGLGPDTFGIRYIQEQCECPAHVPNQIAATFYESGILGLLALVSAVMIISVRAWRAGYAAYTAAIVVLTVGYQFTDAVRFASGWILVGTAMGLVAAVAVAKRADES